MLRCITKKEDFKHEQDDPKSYGNDILQMIKLMTWTVIKFIVNEYQSFKLIWYWIKFDKQQANTKIKNQKKNQNLNQGP